MKILIKGVRDTTHSVAVVNQFNLLALGALENVQIAHWDAPHSYSQVNPGFCEIDSKFIQGLNTYQEHDVYDVELNMSTHLECATKIEVCFNFFVTEFGHLKNEGIKYVNDTFNSDSDLIVPSHWVKQIIKRNLKNVGNIHVIPHGASSRYFFPIEHENSLKIRSNMGFKENDRIFLNLGAMTWNKGIDKLIYAFGIINKIHPNTKLILKDSANLYGVKATNIVNDMIAKGLIDNSAASSISTISQNINFEQLNNLYNIADCYLAPYRAEGFNIPVLESMFCNTPVIVSRGGSTDDFANTSLCTKIDANFVESEIGFYLEPYEDALISAMESVLRNDAKYSNIEKTEHEIYKKNFTTDLIAQTYLKKFIEKKNRQ